MISKIDGGFRSFCHLGYVHIGMDSPLEENAQGFIDKLAALGSGEIVFIHDDCYSMISKMPEYNVQVPFKAVHIVECMRNYLKQHQDRITPLERKIAYQRPCASRYTGEMAPVLDETFELLGVERVARKYERESALCCGSLFSRIDPERIKPSMAKNVQDASEAGAEAMVFLCPLCMGALAEPAREEGLKPLFIT